MTEEDLPPIIKEVGFDFDWDEGRVWALNVPVTTMLISELDWHFDIPFWHENHKPYCLKPKDVINDPKNHQTQYDRTLSADTNYPLDIMENKGRWLILDGLHRLVKLAILGKTEVEVRIIPRGRIPDIEK